MGTPAVVTPEAVPLDLQPAGLGSRFVALLIDWAVQAMLGFALLLVGIGLSCGEAGGVGIALFFLLTFAGALRVPHRPGDPLAGADRWARRPWGCGWSPPRAGRCASATPPSGPPWGWSTSSLTSGAAAVISVLATRNNQRLGDLVAGTLVLRERTGLPPPQAAEFSVPAGLESYAASLDVSGMTADDYRAVRAFLLRAPGLDYKVRYQLAIGLADPLSDRVRPMPPAGVHPAWWLICVAAVYQQRTAPRPPTPWSPSPPALRRRLAPPPVAAAAARGPGPGPGADVMAGAPRRRRVSRARRSLEPEPSPAAPAPEPERPVDGGGFAPLG